MLAWSPAFFWLQLHRHAEAVPRSGTIAAGIGGLVALLWFAAQMVHIRQAMRSAPLWTIFRNAEPIGQIDNASLAELRLIAMRDPENVWAQIGVGCRCVLWIASAWIARVPATAFWVVLTTGMVDHEAFFKLALAMHPDALDLRSIAALGIVAGMVAAGIAAWCVVQHRERPPWMSCYRNDLHRMLREHCGTKHAGGVWLLVAQPTEAEDDYFGSRWDRSSSRGVMVGRLWSEDRWPTRGRG